MPVEDDLNPFVGPRPFERADMEAFFGRDREVRELVSLIFANRVVLVCAPSGAGKTSLLNAALIPALEQEEEFDVLPVARVRGLKADAGFDSGARNVYVFNVLSNWAEAVVEAAQRPTNVAALSKRSVRRTRDHPPLRRRAVEGPLTDVSLVEFLAERPHPLSGDGFPAPRAVVFDQFEELFRLHPEHWAHRGPFFEQIADALREDDLLRIVFAMREEYLAEFDKYGSLLPRPPAPFRLERLGFDAALAAVRGPLRKGRRSFAPGVAESLVRNLMKFRVDTGLGDSIEVEGETVEPVQLQVVCRSLWSDLPPEVELITEGQVSAFGDVDEVLARFYSQAIKAAAAKASVSERELRVWFERQFITVMGTRSTVYRTRLSTAGMTNDAIDELEAQHLIRAEWRAGARWYELTHDRLIAPVRASNRAALYDPIGLDAEKDARRRANQALARAEAAWQESRQADVEAHQQEAIRIYESLGDRAAVADTLMRMGELYRRSEDLTEARNVAGQAGEIYGELGDRLGTADADRLLGLVEAQSGAGAESLTLLTEALLIYRDEGRDIAVAWTSLFMAETYSISGESDRAIDLAQESLALFVAEGEQSGAASALETLGALELEAGRDELALRHYHEAQQIHWQLGDLPSVSAVLARSAEIRFTREEFHHAASLLTDAIKLTPDDLTLYAARADAYWYDERYDEAIADFDEVLVTFPGDPYARSGRGGALADAGRFEAALAELDRAIELSNDELLTAYATNGRALALGGLGRYDEAFKAFEASLDMAPDNAFAFYNRAKVHSWAGDPDRARTDLIRSLDARTPPLSRVKRETVLAALQDAERR